MLPLGPTYSATIPHRAIHMFQRIRGAHADIQCFAYYLEYLTFHMPEPMFLPALEWLLRNGVVGQKFVDFIHVDCSSSALEMIRKLTMRLEKEKKPRVLTTRDVR